ncbi:ABC transporter substrate-binding protein [Clostridium sp. WILCCON 0269]|uniref:ABC transporter substrate-binding protein n=1 Tax=Candidatus Clostridium eludens TaxID=3381663 RepID=A0ABW8SHA7_9CLOT
MKKKLLFLLSLILLFSLTGCGSSSKDQSSSSSGDKELVVVDWGGAYSKARQVNYDAFEKKYGVKVTVVNPTDYGKLKAMVQSKNVEWDVVNVDSDFAPRGGKQGLLEKLDYNVIKADNIDKGLVNEYGVGSDTFDVAISYNTSSYSKDKHPTTWAEVWDTQKFPGARSMWKYPVGTLETALLADGVKPENLYPLDVDRAFKSLDKIKSSVKIWWSAGAQAPQSLASGDVSIAAAWNGRISTAKKEGSPVDVDYNQAIVLGDSWVIPKGAPHKDLAMKFIAFECEPEQQAAFSKNIDYAPTNSKALDLLSAEVKERIGRADDETSKKLVHGNEEWWAENYDAVDAKFQQWLIK